MALGGGRGSCDAFSDPSAPRWEPSAPPPLPDTVEKSVGGAFMLARAVQIGLGVLSGVGVSAIAAWFAYFREKRADRRRHIEHFTFEIYMLLLI
jgi:hypothetical protein